MNHFITSFIVALLLLSCNKNAMTEPDNTPPIINNIIIYSDNPKINQVIKILALVSDIDKQKLYYKWSVSNGTLTNNNEGNPIYWSTPSTIGNVIITCMVYDGVDVTTKSTAVEVSENLVQSE